MTIEGLFSQFSINVGTHRKCLANGYISEGIFSQYTVKFLNFRTRENFAVIYLKFKKRGQTLGISSKICK